jgi:hypothetical protein
MIKQQKEEKNKFYKCEFLCGRIATGSIKPTEKQIYTYVRLAATCLIQMIKWYRYHFD